MKHVICLNVWLYSCEQRRQN